MLVDRPFWTPIFYKQYQNEKLFGIQEEIGKSIKDREWYFNEEWNTHWVLGDFQSDIIEQLSIKKFASELDDQIRVICDEIGFPYTEYRRESWFTKLEQGNYAHKHNHGTADLSGVYYYKTNGEDDGPLPDTSYVMADVESIMEKLKLHREKKIDKHLSLKNFKVKLKYLSYSRSVPYVWHSYVRCFGLPK